MAPKHQLASHKRYGLMKCPRIESALQDWPQWPLPSNAEQPKVVRELERGLNHSVALLKTGSTYWVLKCFSSNAQRSIAAQAIAANAQLAPSILFDSAAQNYCLMEFCTENQTEKLHTGEQINSLAHSLSRLHKIDDATIAAIDGAQTLNTHWDLKKWLSDYDKKIKQDFDESRYSDISDIQAEIVPALESFSNDQTPFCFCHNDLVTENCFVTDTATQFIDWEFAQLNNPWFDLASTIYYFQLNEQQTTQLLKTYAKESELNTDDNNILFAAKCSVIWLDILWHLSKFGPTSWHQQQQKFPALKKANQSWKPSSS